MKENNKDNKDNNNLENLKALENSFKNEGTQEDNSEIINNTPKESDREFLGDYKLPNLTLNNNEKGQLIIMEC